MTGCEVVYFKTERGNEPVREFISTLDISSRRKYWRKIDYLKQYGRSIREPHSKNLGNDIHELRIRGSDGHIRVMYFFFNEHYAILTNAFKKKTNQTPRHEIELVISRMNIFRASPERYSL